MTATNVVATPLFPLGGATNAGWVLGWVDSGAKAAQNDTWVVTNADAVIAAWPTLDATGAAESHTIATNVITLTGATGTACSALVLFQI
jgi:hypothetical protein